MKSEILNTNELTHFFGEKFEFIDSGFSTGQFNMDFDVQRTIDVAEGKALPMFRVYGWIPWAVSLGYNQKEEDIDKEKCEKKGFDLVRRPTGGRAVLHANEITYSVVVNLPDGRTIHDIYREIHTILLKAFISMGCKNIGFQKAQTDFREHYKSPGMSVSCFTSSARYEIEYEGRKVVGSAQRLFGKTLLQHGSILLSKGHEQIADVIKSKNESDREKLRGYLSNHSSTLEESASREISHDECRETILKIFKDGSMNSFFFE
ncbi:MAG: lipoate--protein ligase family protein [Bacteroidetes bacterium]|nr:lipoate--protein ligase family protein [Bacteroidota bacterium]